MQIKTGQGTNTTAAVTNGSATVTAAAGSDWSAVTVGSQFTVAGSYAVYQVAACALVSGVWTITLTANYAGTTNAAVSYVIHKDFGINGEPIFAFGDTEWQALLNRWTASIGSSVASFSPTTFDNVRKSPSVNKIQIENDDIPGNFHTVTIRSLPGGGVTLSINPTPET